MKLALMRTIIGIGFSLLFVFAHTAQAATFNVACNTADLVTAINTANGNGEADTINLTAGCDYAFASENGLDSALPHITSPITINGNGATIRRSGGAATNFRLMYVTSTGDLTLENISITGGNSASYGGGIYTGGTLTVTDSILSNNHSSFDGGGIFSNQGTLAVTRSTLSSNSASNGGGISNLQGTLTLVSSVLSGNTANSGGGVDNFGDIAGATVTNSTIAGNSANTGGGFYNAGSGTLTVTNSIVWGNNSQISGTATVSDSVVQGGFAGLNNFNDDPLFVNTVSHTLAPTTDGDYHIQGNSPAINAGDNTAATGIAADIDGEARILYGTVDIGADEVDYCAGYASPHTVPASDTADLAQAVRCANEDPDANVINLTDSVYSFTEGDVDFIDSALPRITTPITINGNGATIQRTGGPNFRLLYVEFNGDLTLNQVTLSGGQEAIGGGILNEDGTLTVINSTLSGNSASDVGGGIWSSGPLTVTNSILSGNSAASSGGGIFGGSGTVEMTNSIVSGNSAGDIGGGIYNESSSALIMVNSSIAGNRASNGGGGIANFGTADVTNSIVWGNNSQISGTATVSYSVVQGGFAGTANLDADPLFVSPEPFGDAPTTDGDYHIQGNSPAIDAGDNTAVTEPFDIDGDARIINGIVDMGADEVDPCAAYASPYTVAASDETALVNAIACANADPDASVINLTTSIYTFTEGDAANPDSALPRITTPITINGSGTTIERSDTAVTEFRLMRIDPSGDLTLNGLILQSGAANDGGALYNRGTLTVTDSVIADNSSSDDGGGIYNDTGATLTVTGSTITGNTASINGGAIYNGGSSSTVMVTDSVITDNSVSGIGGGIRNDGTLTVTSSTIAGNSANDGGGIGNSFSGAVTVTNSIVSGNSANWGGGIRNSGDMLTVSNSTIAGNSDVNGGGGIYNSFATLTMTNSIVWGNGTQIGGSGGTETVTYSIVEGGFTGTGNLDADPQFAAPESSGSAPTMAGDYHIQSSSPAIDKGNNAAVTAPFDIDGEARIVGGIVDMGADEVDYCVGYASPHTVPAGDTTDLMRAIKCANADPDANVINLTASTYTFTSANDIDAVFGDSALPKITTEVTINGNGATIKRDGAAGPDFRILRVENNGDLTLDTLTVRGGVTNNFSSSGGGIYNGGALTVTDSTISDNIATLGGGGGIYNADSGTLTVTGSTFSGNSTDIRGGGIYNGSDGTVTVIGSTFTGNNVLTGAGGGIANEIGSLAVIDSTITGNIAEFGAGIYNTGGTVTLTDTTISANIGGGILSNLGVIEIMNSTIADNDASLGSLGGGVASDGTVTLTNSTISGNIAVAGGGLFNYGGDFLVSNSIISGNIADELGGGIWNGNGGAVTLINSTVTGNSAADGGGIYNDGSFDEITDPSTVTVTNSIVWGNNGQIVEDGGAVTVTYSIVEGDYAGEGNLDADPLFVAPVSWENAPTTDGGYHLEADSPAINAGDNDALPPEVTSDLDGSPRIVNGVVDMGAYEHQVEADVVLSATGVSATEGGATDSYTVRLASKPLDEVTVSLETGGQTTVEPDTLTFTPGNWSTEQEVMVTAVDDGVIEGAHSDIISHTASSADAAYDGIAIASVNVTVEDNDESNVVVDPTTVDVTEGGATGTYTVVLASEPADDVTITVTGDTQCDVSPDMLNFTSSAWSTPQDVTVTAIDDNEVEGPHTCTITHSATSNDPAYDGITIADVTVAITDNDAPVNEVELLVNGGFELDTDLDKVPDGWSLKNASKDKLKCNTIDKLVSHTGDCAFKFKGGVPEKAKLIQNVDFGSVTLDADDTLTLSAYFKGGSAAKAKFILKVAYVGVAEADKVNVTVGPNGEYTRVAVDDLVIGAGEMEQIKVMLKHKSAAGKLWVDTASLLLTPASTTRSDALPVPAAPDGFRGGN